MVFPELGSRPEREAVNHEHRNGHGDSREENQIGEYAHVQRPREEECCHRAEDQRDREKEEWAHEGSGQEPLVERVTPVLVPTYSAYWKDHDRKRDCHHCGLRLQEGFNDARRRTSGQGPNIGPGNAPILAFPL